MRGDLEVCIGFRRSPRRSIGATTGCNPFFVLIRLAEGVERATLVFVLVEAGHLYEDLIAGLCVRCSLHSGDDIVGGGHDRLFVVISVWEPVIDVFVGSIQQCSRGVPGEVRLGVDEIGTTGSVVHRLAEGAVRRAGSEIWSSQTKTAAVVELFPALATEDVADDVVGFVSVASLAVCPSTLALRGVASGARGAAVVSGKTVLESIPSISFPGSPLTE